MLSVPNIGGGSTDLDCLEKFDKGKRGHISFADVTPDAFPDIDNDVLTTEVDQARFVKSKFSKMSMTVCANCVHTERAADGAAGPANRKQGGENDGGFVLIRSASRTMSRSESDGSVASSPEDSMIESLVWRDRSRDKLSLTTLPEKLDSLKGSPYVGTFHHGHGSRGTQSSPPKPPAPPRRKFVYRKSISDASDKSSTLSADLDAVRDITHEVEEMDGTEHRTFIKEALKLEDHVPTTPELCGIQGLLPRKSGVRVLEKIGEGSFGKIVKARNQRNTFKWDRPKLAGRGHDNAKVMLNKWCKRDIIEYPTEGETLVLKCIRSSSVGEEGCACIQREIRIHARCHHPNIVKMYGHYDHDAYVTIILGYVVGKELYSLLEMQRRFEEEAALPLFLQMLGAVEHLHSMHIVHRDLKPRNILITAAMRVYVIDLGLALDLADPDDKASWRDCMVGTMGYLAPEMHLQKDMGLPVDMWALGVTFYETVCGFPPFQPHEVASSMAVEFPDAEMWGIGVSKELEHLISGMLNKDASKRITASQAMQHRVFTPMTVAEVVTAIEAPEPHSVEIPALVPEEAAASAMCLDPEQEGAASAASGTCEVLPLKLELTQSNSIDWTGQYYFNYCLATVADLDAPDSSMEVPGP